MGEEKDSDTVGVAMKLPQNSSQNGILASDKLEIKIEPSEVLVESPAVKWTAVEEENDSDSALRFAQGSGQNNVLPSDKVQIKIETSEVLVESLRIGNSKTNGEKGSVEDDELTSLSWLQDTNLLKNMRMGTYGDESEDLLSDSPTSDFLEDPLDLSSDGMGRDFPRGVPAVYNPKLHVNAKPPYSFSCLIFMAIEDSPNKALPVKDIYSWILTHFPYFQKAPTGWKNSVRHNLSLNKCFRKVNKDLGQNIGKGSLWCIDPEFRPNLLHAIRRAPYHPYTQLHHFHRLSVQNTVQSAGTDKHMPLNSAQSNVNIPSPDLFPYLSRRLAASGSKGDPEVDAAATMLALKNGPQLQSGKDGNKEETEKNNIYHRKKTKRKYLRISDPDIEIPPPESKGRKLTPVITNSPSEDHTYSASPSQPNANCCSAGANSPSSSIDEAFEFSDGGGSSRKSDSNFSSQETDEDETVAEEEKEANNNNGRDQTKRSANTISLRVKARRANRDADEERKVTEGAHALLNLAKIATATIKRHIECSDDDRDSTTGASHTDDR